MKREKVIKSIGQGKGTVYVISDNALLPN